MLTGRPSDFTAELADVICGRMADGESLVAICKDEAMPHRSTVLRWLPIHPDFRDKYALAREAQADAIFDESIDIADDGSNDWMVRNDPENMGWAANGEHIQRSKLRIDTRKWMASKLRPKVYGEKTTIAGDPENPLIPEAKPPRELAKLILSIFAQAQQGTDAPDSKEP